jgi:DnaJ-class molecular chaperone
MASSEMVTCRDCGGSGICTREVNRLGFTRFEYPNGCRQYGRFVCETCEGRLVVPRDRQGIVIRGLLNGQ